MKIKRKHSIPESNALFMLREWCTLAPSPFVAVSSDYLVSSLALPPNSSIMQYNSIFNCRIISQNLHCFDGNQVFVFIAQECIPRIVCGITND